MQFETGIPIHETRGGHCIGVTKHGKYNTPENKCWNGMRQRCLNPRDKDYPRYGGRGITVCERWNSFENFLADMGLKPTAQHSIDRIDNNGNYEPSNCRWATPLEQRHNTRKPVLTPEQRRARNARNQRQYRARKQENANG